jgi:hypothetical protein
MSSIPLSRLLGSSTALHLGAITGSTTYLRSHIIHNYVESEARLDVIKRTLRGHGGVIEDALERLEKGGSSRKERRRMGGVARRRSERDGFEDVEETMTAC